MQAVVEPAKESVSETSDLDAEETTLQTAVTELPTESEAALLPTEGVPLASEGQPKKTGLAMVRGEQLTFLPKDLYIPPDALEVILETFEGPLDLLLYLIKRQNLEILDIPVAEITRQYVSYVELMQNMNFELAAEYLVMAAMLAEIKSRMLLPRPAAEEGDEESDPRAELIRRLQEYERFKEVAQEIEEMPREERDFLTVSLRTDHFEVPVAQPTLDLKELLAAFLDVMDRSKLSTSHLVERESLSLRERMTSILQQVRSDQFTRFSQLFKAEEGRAGIVVTFIAILELLRQSMIEMVQAEAFAPIHIKAV